MNKFVIAGSIALALILALFYFRHPLGKKIIINGHIINIEVAVTNSEKQKGLGDRDSLASDSGMLFVYQNRDRYDYWMKGMRFPLDYIWIDGNRVVDLSPNIPAPAALDEAPYELAPKVPVDKVLEVNAGTIQILGTQVGDTVSFSN